MRKRIEKAYSSERAQRIAIVIPVYNAKKYIRKCIKSIIKQSYTNWRIIAVDDGSTDGSSLILDKMARTDERIVILHQKNGGSFEARKRGILSSYASECEYITFVDADDYLPQFALEKMYNLAIKEYADLVCGPMERVYKGIKIPSVMSPCFRIDRPKTYTHEEFIEKLFVSYSNFAHRFCLCTLKIQYLAGIRLSKFTLCPMPPEAVSSTKQAMCS